MQNIMIEILFTIFVLNPISVMICYRFVPTLIISLHIYPVSSKLYINTSSIYSSV